MKVLITGGTGLIGSALTASLTSDGHEVIVLSRNPESVKDPIQGVKFQQWNGKTAEGWGHLVNEVDAIVNLAGQNISSGCWNKRHKQRILDSRVNAGKALVQAVEQAHHKPSVLIQISGVGYYGVTNPELLDENTPPGNDFLSDVGQVWEASTRHIESLGVRRVVIRSGVVFSKRDVALALMLLPFRFFVGGPIGSGRQWLSWVHLEDAVRAIRFLIENDAARGVFNLSGVPVTNGEFSRTAGRVMRRPSIIRIPAFALKFIIGEMGTVVLDGQRVSSKKLTDLGFKFKFEQVGDALEDLI